MTVVADAEDRCVISSRGTDGIGHQLQAKLSCLAASSALPGVRYAEHPVIAAQYVSWQRSSIMASSAANVTLKQLDKAFSEPIAACGYRRWNRHLNRSWPRSGGSTFTDTGEAGWRHALALMAAGKHSDLSCKLQRQAGRRGSSLLWRLWNQSTYRCPLARPGRGHPIFFSDNCWDLTGCTESDLMTRWLASVEGACVRGAIVAANPRPVEFSRERTHVVLHIRRGDAIGRQRALGTSPAYYVAVMAKLEQQHPQAQFWLSSDTHFDVIKNLLIPGEGGTWEKTPGEVEAAAIKADRAALRMLRSKLRNAQLRRVDVLTDFRRMLHADVLVLAASSLSYSAGLLAYGRGKRVVAPACWPTVSELARDDQLAVKAFALLPHFSTAPCVNQTGARTSALPGPSRAATAARGRVTMRVTGSRVT